MVAALVLARELVDDLLGGEAFAKQLEPVRPVARVRVRLGRDGSDVRLRPGDDRADGEELRLDRDAPLLRVEVDGDDRVGREIGLSHTWP